MSTNQMRLEERASERESLTGAGDSQRSRQRAVSFATDTSLVHCPPLAQVGPRPQGQAPLQVPANQVDPGGHKGTISYYRT